jgi:hypothetical protein
VRRGELKPTRIPQIQAADLSAFWIMASLVWLNRKAETLVVRREVVRGIPTLRSGYKLLYHCRHRPRRLQVVALVGAQWK